MEEAVTELFETDPTTPEYQEILTRVNKFSSIAENPFLANISNQNYNYCRTKTRITNTSCSTGRYYC